MPSQGVLDRERAGRQLAAAVRTHAPALGEQAKATLAAGLQEGESLPDVSLFFDLVLRLLQSRIEDLQEADQQLLVERFEHQEAREQRDTAANEVHSHLVQLRRGFDITFGVGSAGALLGLTGRLPKDPLRLVRLGGLVLTALRRLLAEGPPESCLPGVELDLEPCTDKLQRELARLDEALVQVRRDEKEAEASLLLKNAAVDACANTARALVTLMRGLCRLVELPLLCREFRFPIDHRRGRLDRQKGD